MQGPKRRPGVPQYDQPHLLVAGGLKAIDEMLPGFRTEVSSPQIPVGQVQKRANMTFALSAVALRALDSALPAASLRCKWPLGSLAARPSPIPTPCGLSAARASWRC